MKDNELRQYFKGLYDYLNVVPFQSRLEPTLYTFRHRGDPRLKVMRLNHLKPLKDQIKSLKKSLKEIKEQLKKMGVQKHGI